MGCTGRIRPGTLLCNLTRALTQALAKVAAGSSIAVALITLVVVATQSASGADNGEWIVFPAAPDGLSPNQLFRLQSDGNGLQQLTKGTASATQPSISPGGRRIAFVRLGRGIYVMNIDGTGERRLTTGSHDLFPVWSPNGRTIAFTRLFKGDYRLYLMGASGGNKRRIHEAPPAGRPSWAANGKSIYLPHGSLDRVDARTGKLEKHVVLSMDLPPTATLSPNTKKVAFYGPRPSIPGCGELSCVVFAVYLGDVPGRVRRFVKDGGPAGWSPDGKRLVFVYRRGLALWPVSGSSPTTLSTGTAAPSADAPPAWQPR
jgi:Tol biopolymer transport system component